MKRGTTPVLKVKIDRVENSDILKIEFLFKQVDSESAPEVLLKEYPGEDVSYDSQTDRYTINLTEEESRKFLEERFCYMDTRITLTNGKIPPTTIEKVMAHKTLFQESDDDD